MNILYTITWPGSSSEELPRQFFNQLRAGVAGGTRFPFECPYEVALLHATDTPDATPPSQAWAVAVLAMRVTTSEIGATDNTLPALDEWFRACIPGGVPPGSVIESAEASHLKLASELRSDYDVIASFGTFVGEPEPEAGLSQPVELPPAQPPVTPETEALKALVGQPLSEEGRKVLSSPPQATPPPPPPVIAPARPSDTNTLTTCLGIGLMVGGVLLIPTSVLLGALLAFGQFSTDPAASAANSTNSTVEFLLLLACCPVPMLILGIGMILLGIFIPRWIKQNQSPTIRPQ